jgi:hypothetical protein
MALASRIVIAAPIPRILLRNLGFSALYHYAPLEALPGIVTRETGRPGDWTECDIRLTASPGWAWGTKRLFRDYSLLDFELKLKERGVYTYFFGGLPSRWGLLKNLNLSAAKPMEEQGWGAVRVGLEDLLARYQGPVFYRADDAAVVIRGGYEGPAAVHPMPVRR